MRFAIAVCLAASVFLNGCGASRPPSVLCGIEYFAASAPKRHDGAKGTMQDLLTRAVASRSGPLEIEILALSAGGQFGAFGAGFLRGWSENRATPRPDFDLVTGVSAGAMIAPVVFAGPAFDSSLDGYRGLGERDVFLRRSLLALPSAPSFASTAPLERFIKDRLSDDMIGEIGRRHTAGQSLLILATDLDTTEAIIFDLGEMAASNREVEEKRDCMAEAMLGSSAIPGLFAPRHIDGSLFADGGLRDQIFLRALEDVRRDVAQATNRDISVSATLIVNGSLRPLEEPVNEGLLAYALRGTVVLADEVLRDSIEDVVQFAERQPNWRIRGIIADTDLEGCDIAFQNGTFDTCVTERLFDDGRAKGAMSPLPWLGPDALLAAAAAL
jgi:predicted acylesterase/phospholipase RssA